MADREATRQVLVVLPVELVDEIDDVVLRRGRSAWIEQACRDRLALEQQLRRPGQPRRAASTGQQDRPETTPSAPKRRAPDPPPGGKVTDVQPRFKGGR